MSAITQAAVQPKSIDTLLDFAHGPFSDNKLFSNTFRRMIVQKIINQLNASPVLNAQLILRATKILKNL